MKLKFYFLFIIALTLISCSTDIQNNFSITNSCSEQIKVRAVLFDDEYFDFDDCIINPNDSKVIYGDKMLHTSTIERVDALFKSITIEKNGIVSTINFADHTYWTAKDDTYKKTVTQNYTLLVKDEYFE